MTDKTNEQALPEAVERDGRYVVDLGPLTMEFRGREGVTAWNVLRRMVLDGVFALASRPADTGERGVVVDAFVRGENGQPVCRRELDVLACSKCRVGFNDKGAPVYCPLENRNGFATCPICNGSYGKHDKLIAALRAQPAGGGEVPEGMVLVPATLLLDSALVALRGIHKDLDAAIARCEANRALTQPQPVEGGPYWDGYRWCEVHFPKSRDPASPFVDIYADTPPESGGQGEALTLAANRLQRLALECPHGSSIRSDANEWAEEARSAATHPPAQASGAVTDDAALLEAIADEYLTIEPFDMPTGQGDADVGWRVYQYQGFDKKLLAEVFHDDLRAALTAALTQGGGNGR